MSTRKLALAAAALALGLGAARAETPNLGRPISPADIAPWDITIMPDGTGLPTGSGTPAQGAPIFAQKCAACHNNPPTPFDQKLVGPGLAKITDDPAHPNLVNDKPPTPANIAEILQNGFTGPIGTMPNRQANALSDKDIADLVAYLVSPAGDYFAGCSFDLQ